MKWVLAETDEKAIAELCSDGQLHPLIARLLVCRGISARDAADAFLACDLGALSDPGIFLDMGKAVERIKKAVAEGERITVYGDYDVDGVTGCALLFLVLKKLGVNVDSYIPDRMSEGYGLNLRSLEIIKAAGTSLVLTVDCGILAFREVERARSLGLDVIITDHHEFATDAKTHGSRQDTGAWRVKQVRSSDRDIVVPDAHAVLHPCLLRDDVAQEQRTRVGGLTGVGIALKLAQAVLNVKAEDPSLQEYFDLVTLGTVADMGKITGENRILVKHGLEMLSRESPDQRPGIAALKSVAGLNGKKIGAGAVGFNLAPRINASGRLEKAETAFRLLTTDSLEEADALAAMLDAVNRERQGVEEQIWRSARQLCSEIDIASAGALVLASEEWHPGVIGIVASRILDEFFRPTALISIQNGVGKGSARSIPGFDLSEGLAACSDLLLGFGGHKYAAGFTIETRNIPLFRERLSVLVLERMREIGFVRSINVDGSVQLSELDAELMREIERLAPFGQGNPEPRFGARRMQVMASRVVGNNHLKLRLRQEDGPDIGAIAFHKGNLLGRQVRDGAKVAAVFTPRLNAWNGKVAVELEIRDIRMEKE